MDEKNFNAALNIVEMNIVVGDVDDATAVINTAGLIADIASVLGGNDRVREAAQRVIAQWETPNWKLTEPTASIINDLKQALAGDDDL